MGVKYRSMKALDMLIHEFGAEITAYTGTALSDVLSDADHRFSTADIKTLIKGKASVHGVATHSGDSALHVAVKRKPVKGAIPLVATLLESGADPNHLSAEKGDTPLDACVRSAVSVADEDSIYLINLLAASRGRLLAAKDIACTRTVSY